MSRNIQPSGLLRRFFLAGLVFGAGAAMGDYPLPRAEDRIRIAEAWQLADEKADKVWPGWTDTPFVILLVTGEFEYLFRHPYPPDDFVSLGDDDITAEEIRARPFTGSFQIGLLATFPAISGVNTVVVGTPENTGKPSTDWVLTLLHEHFHQLQYGQPDYYDAVNALDLCGGDQTGMWQLNYPFPYDTPRVVDLVHDYRDRLLRAWKRPNSDSAGWMMSRGGLKTELDPRDYRYLAFQLWQEGVARYTEYAIAREATDRYEPRADFLALDGVTTYEHALAAGLRSLESELRFLDLPSERRTAVYPLGAAEALLLDNLAPGWKSRYFTHPFDLDVFNGWSRSGPVR